MLSVAAWFAAGPAAALICDKDFEKAGPGRQRAASIRPMDAPDGRLRLLRRLAWACAVLVLAVTSLSAYIRLSRAGLGCEPWPQCHAQRAILAAQALERLDPPAVTSARLLHRTTASATLLVVVTLLVLTLARRPILWPQGRIVLGLLALAVFLALLGRLGGVSRAPGVTLGNLLAGFAMLALGWRLVQAFGPARSGVPALRRWTIAAAVLLVLQITLGGWASTHASAARCDATAACQLHAFVAPPLVALVLGLGIAAWRLGERPSGAAIALLAMAQAGLGLAQVAGPLPLALGLAHNVTAALLLPAVLGLLPSR